MSEHEIGVDVDDFRLSPKDALSKASQLEFRSVEMGAVHGDVAAWNLSASGRRHLSRYADGLGLRLSALSADLPTLKLNDAATVDERVARTMKILDMARDMDVPIVSSAAGMMTDVESAEPIPIVVEALCRIGEHAESRGRVFALRPSFDAGQRLVSALKAVDCPSVRVCLDPAAMVMTGCDPLACVNELAERVALFHARDATVGRADHPGSEALLGEGEVDLLGVLAMLDAADYREPYILRRTESHTPAADLTQARESLQRLLPPA